MSLRDYRHLSQILNFRQELHTYVLVYIVYIQLELCKLGTSIWFTMKLMKVTTPNKIIKQHFNVQNTTCVPIIEINSQQTVYIFLSFWQLVIFP